MFAVINRFGIRFLCLLQLNLFVRHLRFIFLVLSESKNLSIYMHFSIREIQAIQNWRLCVANVYNIRGNFHLNSPRSIRMAKIWRRNVAIAKTICHLPWPLNGFNFGTFVFLNMSFDGWRHVQDEHGGFNLMSIPMKSSERNRRYFIKLWETKKCWTNRMEWIINYFNTRISAPHINCFLYVQCTLWLWLWLCQWHNVSVFILPFVLLFFTKKYIIILAYKSTRSLFPSSM